MDSLAYIMGQRISEVRGKTGLSQTDFATRIGVSASVVSQYETAKRKPSVDVVFRIAQEFGISVNYIFGLKSDDPLDENDLASFFYLYKGLDKADKTVIKEMIAVLSRLHT